jgi:hypothetical protein
MVSIILCVRNGMPHVRDAVESVRALSCQNYELVIQDGASTDGTLEYLQGLQGFSQLSLVSAPDSGMGQGFNRALQRCRADIITSVDADNLLVSNALDIGLRGHAQHPGAAAVYGACNMIDEQNRVLHTWIPEEFDVVGLIEGVVVPPFGCSFFSRKSCGDELHFDEEFPVVPDIDLWLRIAHLPIVRMLDATTNVRIGPQSSTWQADAYDLHSQYKKLAVARFLAGPRGAWFLDHLSKRAQAGIDLWVLDSMGVIGAGQDHIDRFFERAAQGDLRTERFRSIVARVRPRVRASDGPLVKALFDCGVEYLQKRRPEEALVYFDLLERSGCNDESLGPLIEESRALLRETNRIRCRELLQESQAEIDSRDRLLVEQNDAMRAQHASLLVQHSDALRAQHDVLQAQIEALHEVLQAEVDRRDRMLAMAQEELRSEVARRNSLFWQLRRIRYETVQKVLSMFSRGRDSHV